MSEIYLDHAAELWTNQGPTGDYVQVLEGELRDAGGNVLFAGEADECARRQYEFRRATKVPTKWMRRPEDVIVGADHLWQCVVELDETVLGGTCTQTIAGRSSTCATTARGGRACGWQVGSCRITKQNLPRTWQGLS